MITSLFVETYLISKQQCLSLKFTGDMAIDMLSRMQICLTNPSVAWHLFHSMSFIFALAVHQFSHAQCYFLWEPGFSLNDVQFLARGSFFFTMRMCCLCPDQPALHVLANSKEAFLYKTGNFTLFNIWQVKVDSTSNILCIGWIWMRIEPSWSYIFSYKVQLNRKQCNCFVTI